jgi:L-alanine-DL-glutamate epimerase-like enolase superfamily enzyme
MGGRTIDGLTAEVYEIPTDQPEADGTLAWSATTMVVARLTCGEVAGLGWTYAGAGAKTVIDSTLAGTVRDRDPMDVAALNEAMARAGRNQGRPGLVACAISAVDVAAWDLKARLLDVSLVDLFGRAVDRVPIYGSGGFTTYADSTTRAQLEQWVSEWEIPRVKIKIGESWGGKAERDIERVRLTRAVVGDGVEVYVDANGGYHRKQAIRIGRQLVDGLGVTWFEEPVSSDDLTGLRAVRDQCDADVTAGEYGYTPAYFAQMLEARAVDCLQADATRCGGYTGWLLAAHLAGAHQVQVSAHCAPNIHAPVAGAVSNLRHVEYFHDHHRIETTLFDGALSPRRGALIPRRDVVGHGLSLRTSDASRYRVA